MRRRFLSSAWLIGGGLLLLAFMSASCASTPNAPSAPVGGSPSAAGKEAPKYGGTLNLFQTAGQLAFDQVPSTFYTVSNTDLTNQELMAGDWTKGPAGTNEATFSVMTVNALDTKTCVLCTDWKIVKPGDMVFKIRHGVHYGLNPNSEASRLVNGRELTADDVVFSLNRQLKGNKYTAAAAGNMVAHTTVTSPDKDTVELKTPPGETMMALIYLVWGVAIVPPEVVAKYGNMNDWHNSVGTGPFLLTDYVAGSSMTFVKNSNYWQRDPVGHGKGNQLPYVDGVKVFVLPDPSTRLTALRTGKIDWLGVFGALTKDDYDAVIRTTPQLKSNKVPAISNNAVYMRTDKQDLPFKDARVRQALTMAIDYKGIVGKLMGGDAEYPGFPTTNIPDFKGIYFPLSEAPKAAQDLYSYNPTKAKQLLAEAGYPNGFKTNMVVNSTGGTNIDQVSVFEDAWSKIGVGLTINPLDNAAYAHLVASRNYDQMYYGSVGAHGIYMIMINYVGNTQYNGSFIDDPKAKQAKDEMFAAEATGDFKKADATYKAFEPYVMEQAWVIPYPDPNQYTVWWPWLKNYDGETSVGYLNGFSWAQFIWIDQELKKSMGY